MSHLKGKAAGFLLVVLFVGLTYAYLYPGSEAVFEGRTDVMMSDGTDPAPVPWVYDLIVDTWHEKPHRLFFGSVYVDAGDTENGNAFWTPWSERWSVVLLSYFLPTEQLYGGYVFVLLLLNGLCMYMLGRTRGWSRTLSYGLAIAWAFCAYTRARAKVHGALAGLYHLPLIFIGLDLVVRKKSKRSLALAALAFLAAGTAAHYYLVIAIFLSPLFVIYAVMQPEFKAEWKRILSRLAIATFPLLVFLAFNRLVPVPSDAAITATKVMELETPRADEIKTFLKVFYAHPIDYLTGDLSLAADSRGYPKTDDLNPLRESFNDHVVRTISEGNFHERTNGIRWVIIGLAAFALVTLVWRRRTLDVPYKRQVGFFALFGGVCFLLSLSPDFPFDEMGLSYFVYTIMPKIRVACRSGIGVNFSLLMIAGLYIANLPEKSKWRKAWLLPGLFPLVMVLDYFPLIPMPLAPVQPAYASLARTTGACGPGMFFPFVNGFFEQISHYTMMQRLRGTDCTVLNNMRNIPEVEVVLRRFPPIPAFMNDVGKNPTIPETIERLANCVPLNWIAFHPAVSRDFAAQTCQRLKWTLHEDGTCIAPDKTRKLRNLPSRCL